MSLFGKIKDALKKTREGVSTKLRLLFAKNKLGDPPSCACCLQKTSWARNFTTSSKRS